MKSNITLEEVERVRELLKLGWSQRQAARCLHMSTTTVNRIAQRKWRPLSEISDDPYWALRLQAKRCRGCGGLVYEWPCRACELRGRLARRNCLLRMSA